MDEKRLRRQPIANRPAGAPTLTTAAHRAEGNQTGTCQRPLRATLYWISVSILNMGRYIEMMITPTMQPTPIIISGSMIEVSAEMEASTSSS